MCKQSPHPPAQITSNLNARNSVHSAAAAILTVKISKLTKEKPVLHFHLSCQKHAKTHVNRLKQSQAGEERKNFCYAPSPHFLAMSLLGSPEQRAKMSSIYVLLYGTLIQHKYRLETALYLKRILL